MTEISYDFPTLETERLILRPLVRADTDFVFRHFSNPAVGQYLMDEPPVRKYSQAEEIVQFYLDPSGKTHNRWILMRKSDHKAMGTCGFHKWDRRYFRAEIGYDLSPDFWRQGYMAEALGAAISHGFEQLRLNRIEALVYVDNERSKRLLQKLGFKKEGLLRDYFYLDGNFYDHYIYGLLKKDYIGETNGR